MPVFIYFLSFLTKGVRAMNSETEIAAEISQTKNLKQNVALIEQRGKGENYENYKVKEKIYFCFCHYSPSSLVCSSLDIRE